MEAKILRKQTVIPRQQYAGEIARDISDYFTYTIDSCEFKSAENLKIDDFMFFKIESFRLSGNNENDLKLIKQAVSSAVCNLDCGVIGIQVQNNKVGVYFGCVQHAVRDTLSRMSNNLDGFAYRETENIGLSEYSCMSVCQGSFSSKIDMSALCRHIIGEPKVFIGFYFKRIPDTEVNYQLKKMDLLSSLLTSFRYEFSGGDSQLFQKNQNENPIIGSALECLENYKQKLEFSRSERAYFLSICIFSEDYRVNERVVSGLNSAYINERNNSFERALKCVHISKSMYGFSSQYLPCYKNKFSILEKELPLFSNSLCGVYPLSLLTDIVSLPTDELPGFYPDIAFRDSGKYNEFDLRPHSSDSDKQICLGTIEKTGENESIDLNSLMLHLGVFGASGSGKSVAIKNVLKELNKNDVPFVIFEAIKGEFSALPAYGIPIKILSSSNSGITLNYNPMIPEELISISDHVRQVVMMITAASDNESPIPEALHMVLLHAYKKHGWNPEDIVFESDTRSFPTFDEVYEEIVPFFRSTNLYSGEVKTNICSALTVRLNTIKHYPFVHGNNKLPTKEILSSNTTIQFDGLNSTADKCFFANSLLTNINEYIRNQDLSETLQHVIVIDEAHIFFENNSSDSNARKSSKGAASEFFTSMLSETRAYGVGMIVADQSPSLLDIRIVSNTCNKIVMGLDNAEDIDVVSDALALSEYQKKLYHTMKPGEAIVCVRGSRNIVKVKIHMIKPQKEVMGMCRFCNRKSRCVKSEVQLVAKELPVSYYAARLKSDISNTKRLGQICEEIAERGKINGD